MSYLGKVRPTVALTSSDIEDNAVTSSKIIADAVTTVKINDGDVTTAKMATDPTNASNLASGTVGSARMGSGSASSTTVLYGDGTWKAEPVTNTAGLEADIALLAFKTQANGSLAKYGLADQVADSFEDTSGIDLSGSTNEIRNAGSYIIGGTAGVSTTTKLTSGTSWTVPAGVYNAEVFIVAGGGGGGNDGGGGAGGVVHDTNHVLTAAATVTYAIGAAGSGGAHAGVAGDGGNTTFSTLVAVGGGGGGTHGGPAANKAGRPGGSGGGGNYDNHPWEGGASTQQTAGTPTGGTITSYGTMGGKGWYKSGAPYQGGGGGGATEEGGIARLLTPVIGGKGGDGIYSDIETPALDNNMGVYAAGGGGSYNHSYPGAIGLGGSQGGGSRGSGGAGGDGGDSTGQDASSTSAGSGGGGAKSESGGTGGDGSAGVALIKYTPITEANLTMVSTATEAVDAVTKGDIVMTYSDGVGTTTLNTDLTAEISADDGSTWTSVTLASQGTTAGHTIVTASDVAITSTITSPADMRYRIKTLNQAAGKQTRIQAVSLGWS